MGSLLRTRSHVLGLLGLFSVVNAMAKYSYTEVWNEEYGIMVTCKEIQCGEGEFAKICNPNDRDSSRCVPCEEGSYQDNSVNLLGDKCKLKKHCLDQNPDLQKCTTINYPGSLTRDANCSCLQGCTLHETLHICMPDERPTTPRLSCPLGQTTKENSTGCFLVCSEGYFKDGDSCKQHTNCRKEGKCLEIKGNDTTNNICSTANFSDWAKDCNQTGPSQQQKSEGPKMLTVILCVTVPMGVISPLAIIAYCVKKRRDKKRPKKKKKMNGGQNGQEVLARLTNETLEMEAVTTWEEKWATDATVLRALGYKGQGTISHTILQRNEGLTFEKENSTVTVENRDVTVHASLSDVHKTAKSHDHRQDNPPPPPCKSVSVNEMHQGKQQRSIITTAASLENGLSSSDVMATSMTVFSQRAGSSGDSKDAVDMERNVKGKETCV